MRKPIAILAVCALCLLAVGAAPRYLEELRIGGGYGSSPDGGIDLEADGDIFASGSVTVNGSLSSAGLGDPTLMGYWALNEGSGTTARDIGNYEHPGIIPAGSGNWSNDSPFRHSYNIGSLPIDCGAAGDLDTLGPQTITAWIKPGDWGPGGAAMILTKSDASTLSDAFWVYNANACLRFRRRFSGGGGYGTWRSATGSIVLNRWQFVAVTYDHSNPSHDPVFYVNGMVSPTTEENAPSGQAMSFPTEPLLLGNSKNGLYNFPGRMADVRYYHRVLSADGIAALYRTGSESPVFQTMSTVAGATIGGGLDVGASATARGVVTAYQGSGGIAPGCIRLLSPAGTSWYLFVRDDGTLKIHSALPTANGSGVVVGGQS